MSQSLYMVQMQINQTALVRFLSYEGLNLSQDEDLGYGLHAWLSASFGTLAPKPFRFLPAKRASVHPRLLAYSNCDARALIEHCRLYAQPAAQAICDLDGGLLSSPLPSEDRFAASRRLGFEVLCCPVARRASDGRERDVFLHAVDHGTAEANLDRERVYREWLSVQLEPYASLDNARLAEFSFVSQVRQGRRDERGCRTRARLTRPRALLRGTLTVRDPHAFREGLARGIGRHRAFGYGMLLLRPL